MLNMILAFKIHTGHNVKILISSSDLYHKRQKKFENWSHNANGIVVLASANNYNPLLYPLATEIKAK